MVYVKVQKNSAYFKRFQTKLERRRNCKTDYYARKRLVTQDKNKYNSPRYRLVVRVTNRDVICQIVYSKIIGDVVLAAAYAHELPLFGASVGLTNYAACYATGLLVARRVLTKLKLDKHYTGLAAPTGENVPRAFKALMDVGLARTTTGARIFAALKGAVDGGLNVPHSTSRFAGYKKDKGELDTEVNRKRIFGVHVAEYQKTLLKDDAEAYNKLFSRYKAKGITPDKVESMWKSTHDAIRKNPLLKKGLKANQAECKKASKTKTQRRTTTAEKFNKMVQKRNALQRKKKAGKKH
jgi:large subunit ribosomal protein L5e